MQSLRAHTDGRRAYRVLVVPRWSGAGCRRRVEFKGASRRVRNPRNSHALTPAGKKQLLRERSKWADLVAAISGVLNPVAKG